MYLRDVHAEADISTLQRLIRENPLGIFTTAIRSRNHPFLQSSHVPFVLDVVDQDEGTGGSLGILRGHLARQNPQSKAMMESVQPPLDQDKDKDKELGQDPPLDPHLDLHPPSGDAIGNFDGKGSGSGSGIQKREAASPRVLQEEVMVLFSSPVHHYVTPKFYIETKPKTGKVVPTWNYAAAQVYGKATIYFDSASPQTADFLSRQITDLSRHAETSIMGYTGIGSAPAPWAVSDAPDRYIQLLRKAIIGIEITIDRLEGKFKMSQESSVGDRAGVVQGFASLGSDLGSNMATIVREQGERKRKT